MTFTAASLYKRIYPFQLQHNIFYGKIQISVNGNEWLSYLFKLDLLPESSLSCPCRFWASSLPLSFLFLLDVIDVLLPASVSGGSIQSMFHTHTHTHSYSDRQRLTKHTRTHSLTHTYIHTSIHR